MNRRSRWIKIGAIGTGITALCCFTPILVWLLAALGLAALTGYLDLVLFPLLGLFVVILVVGLLQPRA